VNRRYPLAMTLVLTLAGTSLARAQTHVVSGRVYSAATQEGLPGAVLSVVGGAQAAQADNEGRYRITLPETDVTLLVRALAHKRTEVRVSATQSTVDIALEKDPLRLEEVVVTGQATTVARQNAATAVTTVSAEQLSTVSAQSLESALQGKVVGARTNMNSGAPGGGGQMQIRGVTTILGNPDPLYVVDGVVISNAMIQSGTNTITNAGGRANIATNQDNATNRLADINPSDIENIQILKGAAASAQYGSRATNGVILITTKRGRQGAPSFKVTQRLGTYDAMRLPGTRRFPSKEAAVEAARVFHSASRAQALVDSLYAINPNPFFDHQKQLFDDAGLSYESVVSLSGGGENTRYHVSGSTKKDDAILLNTGSKKDGLLINVDHQLRSRLSVEAGLQVHRSATDRGISNNDNTFISPFYNFAYTPAIIDLARQNPDGSFPVNPFPGGGGRNASNPFQTLSFIKNREDVWRQIGNANIKWNAWSSDQHVLTLSLRGGVDRFNQDNHVYSPNFLQYEGNDGFFGRAVQGNTNSRNLNASLNGVWEFSPSALPFTATTSVGVTTDEQNQNEYRVQSRGIIPGIQNINQGTIATFQRRELTRDHGVYAQEEILAFDDRLNVSVGVRADRSSANGDREKFFVFPKYSAAYRFVNPISSIDFVKLRAALGRSGNRPVFGNRDIVLNNTGRIGGREAIGAFATLGNPGVEPERVREMDFGADGALFDERIGFEATYFNRKVTNLLLNAPLAPSSGLAQQIFNGGEMETDGVELALTLNPVRGWRGLEWVSRATFYTVDQMIVDLPVPRFVLGSTGFGTAFGRVRIAEGVSTTAIWGNAPIGPGGAVVDTIIGEATPDFEMGFANDFTWRGFALNVLVDWRKGGDVSNLTNTLFDEGRTSRDFDDPSPDVSIGRTLGEYRYNKWDGGSDARVYVQDGSFVKLREIAVSYKLPGSLTNRLFAGRARDASVSLSGRNLAIWSDYWGPDPEVNNFGNQPVGRFVDLAPYPPSRSFFFSVDVGF
jgi:TonB-linked SusC/RagA family outer membrane protein